MKFGDDGRLYAINPEAGFFGVAPGTGEETNPNAMKMVEHDTVFTNCARTDDGDVWWEGLTDDPPAHAIDWHGQRLDAGLRRARRARERALHRAAPSQDPAIAPEWEDPKGVPIDAMLFGGRRSTTEPARHRGARLAPRRPARLDHGLGDDRGDRRRRRQAAPRPVRDAAVLRLPHGRLLRPLAGASASATGAKLPKLFNVNWFRKDPETGEYLWPGFGDNSRVLAWVFERCDDDAEARETADRPAPDAPTRSTSPGWTWRRETLEAVLDVDLDEWRAEIPLIREFFEEFGDQPAGRAARGARRARGAARGGAVGAVAAAPVREWRWAARPAHRGGAGAPRGLAATVDVRSQDE